eukprot:8570669-Pyramimonas_sp.AAC.1
MGLPDICGSMSWSCTLQSEIVNPVMTHLKQCNALLARAIKSRIMNGLRFRELQWSLRLVSITGAGHASKRSGYPFE